MRAGTLVEGLPSTVNVGGISLPLATGHRTWLRVWELTGADDVAPWVKALGVFKLAYGGIEPVAGHEEEALEQALAFLDRTLGSDVPPRPLTMRERRLAKKRLFDWTHDAQRLVADFQREYGMDLTDPGLELHWWRFMALFNGLSDASGTMEAIAVRAADLDDKGLSKEGRKSLRERKAGVLLPARNEDEAREAQRILRGS